MYDIQFTDQEIESLKFKKILRQNLISKDIVLCNKIDEFCNKYKVSFSESVYIIVNKIQTEVLCLNCQQKKPSFVSCTVGYKKYCSAKCSNSHIDVIKTKKSIYLEKYGVDNPAKNDIIRKIISEKAQNQSYETKEKRKKTNLQKFGHVTNLQQDYVIESRNASVRSEKTKEKRKESNKTKYGFDSYTMTFEYRKKTIDKWIKNEINRNRKIIGDSNFQSYIGESIYKLKCDCGLEHDYEIHQRLYHARKRISNPTCTVCYPISENSSIKQKELLNFIRKNYTGQIIENYRDKLEIDIYLPSLNIGFEFNGLYWHSENYKSNNYHINKTNYFKNLGIRIIHIWEDDWNLKRPILESQIKNWLGVVDKKIFARKCQIKEIHSTDEYRDFLNENHIQGYIPAKLKIGLYYENSLISVMTFDKFEGRKNMETTGWNLSRFCNKLDFIIVGGASKLLKYFINKYKPTRIISFADREWSLGNLYFSLGFNLVSESKQNYKYVVDEKRVNKQKFKKSRLMKLGHDPNSSETEIMKSIGYYRVYDCGQLKFELNI